MEDKTKLLEDIELALSEGVASLEKAGHNDEGEWLLKYSDVQNKIGEIVWDKIAILLTPPTEQ